VFAIGLSFDDAEAKKDKGIGTLEIGDEFILKGKGTGICTSGDDSGTVKANVRFLLLVEEADGDISNGVAKAQIKLQTKCEGAPKTFENDGALAFTLDKDNGILTMSGDLKARDGTIYSLDVIGQVNEGKKTTIDMSFVVHEIPTGITFEIPILGGVIMMPITS